MEVNQPEVQDSLKENNRNPLVSIIVITYNSAKYVLDTLESAKAQTYQNIELIISDDCSKDDTIVICKKWIAENKACFVKTELITVAQNTGIPANCNRGLKVANGEWIKLIAGDDKLTENALSDYILYVKDKNIDFLFSDYFLIDSNGELIMNRFLNYDLIFFQLKSVEQYKKLVIGNVTVPALTSFIKKEVIISLNGYDEDILMCEDYPMWIKATSNGFNLSFIDKKTAFYRLHEQSVMRGGFNISYQESMKKVFFKYRLKIFLFNPLIALEELVWNLTRTNYFLYKYIRYFFPSTIYKYILKRVS